MFLPLNMLSGGGKTYGNLEEVIYLGNYDGDTIRFDIPSVHPLIGRNVPVRVRGMDTPEIRGKCPAEKRLAKQAKNLVRRILEAAGRITLKKTGRGKYFRIVAYVEADGVDGVDGVDVGEVLLKEGLAVLYQGGRKVNEWCGDDP